MRTLSQPARPGSHPLRALRTGAAQPGLPAREWASISALADPVGARMGAAHSVSPDWQWTALPVNFAPIVTASGILGVLTRLLAVGAAHADRCVRAPSVRPARPRCTWSTLRAAPSKSAKAALTRVARTRIDPWPTDDALRGCCCVV